MHPREVQVRTGVHEITVGLFGRHVRRRAEHSSARLEAVAPRAPGVEQQPEIHDDGATTVHHQDVLRLQVSVDDSFAVQVGQRRAEPPNDGQCTSKPRQIHPRPSACGRRAPVGGREIRGVQIGLRLASPARLRRLGSRRLKVDGRDRLEPWHRWLIARNVAPQTGPFHELHGVPRQPVVRSTLQDAHDARMTDPGQCVDLAAQALEQIHARHQNCLQRRGLARLPVHSTVDATHASLSQDAQDPVRPERLQVVLHSAPRPASRRLCRTIASASGAGERRRNPTGPRTGLARLHIPGTHVTGGVRSAAGLEASERQAPAFALPFTR